MFDKKISFLFILLVCSIKTSAGNFENLGISELECTNLKRFILDTQFSDPEVQAEIEKSTHDHFRMLNTSMRYNLKKITVEQHDRMWTAYFCVIFPLCKGAYERRFNNFLREIRTHQQGQEAGTISRNRELVL